MLFNSKWIKSAVLLIISLNSHALPKNFVYLKDVSSDIKIEMRYFSNNNFVGRAIKGYYTNRCILTKQAAVALGEVQRSLKLKGYGLIVYDCYRPKEAVEDFYSWSKNSDKRMKSLFYPRENKKNLFKRGYIAKFSAHSRGSTVDLSLYKKPSMQPGTSNCLAKDRHKGNSLDMGTNYDCLDLNSGLNAPHVSPAAKKNRKILRHIMISEGFKPYAKEWWHFKLKNEPYKRMYFNFPVK